MILRRIASALKGQDWATVMVEFILIIVGVLVALQFDNWNEARKDRALEQQYLERLFADLNGSIEDFSTNLDWDLTRLERQYIVLESLRAGSLAPENETAFASGLAWAGVHNPQRRRWGTVDELVSTGNIALIRDLELRKEISSLGAWYDRNNELVNAAMDRAGRLRQELTRHYDIRAFDARLPGDAIVVYDFEALAQNSAFINSFADLQLASDSILGFAYGSMVRFEALRDQLAGEFGVSIDTLPKLPKRDQSHWKIVPEEKKQ